MIEHGSHRERSAAPRPVTPAVLALACTAMGLATLILASCAPLAPVPGGLPTPPVRSSRTSTPAKPPAAAASRPAARRGLVPADSLPSAEALIVLQSIPEPLRPGEQVSLPAGSAGAAIATAMDVAEADSAGADVPVPEPTLPLGERRRVLSDSTVTSTNPTNPAPVNPLPVPLPAVSSATPATPAAIADTCWRVQVLAPLAADEAEGTRATASSLLVVVMVVEHEAGRYKVRTRDCFSREAADLLRRRAIDSGFVQAFRISGVKR